ncbi:MAG: Spy/CpxP family protein refolding chaperone [Pseudomonadaceae bacterium]|nr:Spy/CpxP family protein refolding chaperone [Pseudomonadaceae bacterium]
MSLAKTAVATMVTVVTVIASLALAGYVLAPKAALAYAMSGDESVDHRAHCALLQDHGEHLNLLAGRMLDLRDDQRAALAPIASTLNELGNQLRPVCESQPATLPERFAAMDSALTIVSSGVASMRDEVDAFYASLDEEQRMTLNEMTKHRRMHRRHGR